MGPINRWILIGFLGMSFCTNEGGASKALRVNGYKNIELTGYAWFACGKDDTTCTGFRAIAPNGEQVTGAVSCAMFGCGKSCTVRVDQ